MNVIVITKLGVRYATILENLKWHIVGGKKKRYVELSEIDSGDIVVIKESSIDHIIIKNNGQEKA